MNIISIIENLYTNRQTTWIKLLDEGDIEPFIIQRWLAMNDMIRVQVRWLDKYVFNIPAKMYLSLAWSIIPKTGKMPYIKYIKMVDEEEEFGFILSRVRRQFKLSDNDYKANKERLIKQIKDNMVLWFSYYGIPKGYWNKYYINFELIKQYGKNGRQSQQGLEAWGI